MALGEAPAYALGMLGLHSTGSLLVMFGGIVATFISCGAAIFAARKPVPGPNRTRRAPRA
jgi:hypothetical protein